MTNEEIISKINQRLKALGGLERSVKIDFGEEGMIFVSGMEAVESDKAADCTIKLSKSHMLALAKGEFNLLSAFMKGELKITGDRSVAMGLPELLKQG